MKTKVAIGLLILQMMAGFTPGGTNSTESDSQLSSSNEESDGGTTTSG